MIRLIRAPAQMLKTYQMGKKIQSLDKAAQIAQALNVLGITSTELNILRDYISLQKEDFLKKYFNFDLRDFTRYMRWNKLSKSDKIKEMIGPMSKPWDFLNLCYARYRRVKNLGPKSRGRWKRRTWQQHLGDVELLIAKAKNESKLSLLDCQDMVVNIYFAAWVAIIGNQQVEEKKKRLEVIRGNEAGVAVAA